MTHEEELTDAASKELMVAYANLLAQGILVQDDKTGGVVITPYGLEVLEEFAEQDIVFAS